MNNELFSNLKHYQSIKEVDSKPCTDHEYNQLLVEVSGTMTLAEMGRKFQHGRPRADTDSPKDGYLMVYNLGKENQFVSWSPKKEFEEGYVELPVRTHYWDTREYRKSQAYLVELRDALGGVVARYSDLTRNFTVKTKELLALLAPDNKVLPGWTILPKLSSVMGALPTTEVQVVAISLNYDTATVHWEDVTVGSSMTDNSRPTHPLDEVLAAPTQPKVDELFWVVESDDHGLVLGKVADEDKEGLRESGARFVRVIHEIAEDGASCLRVDPAEGEDGVRDTFKAKGACPRCK